MKKMKLHMKTQMKNKWKNNFKHFQSVARCESYNVWYWKSGDASSKRHLTKHDRRFCWLTESIQSLHYELGLHGPTDSLVISILVFRFFCDTDDERWWTSHFPCQCFQDIPCAMALGSLSLAGGMMMQLSCKMYVYSKPESLQWLHQGYRIIRDHIGMRTQISRPYFARLFFSEGNHHVGFGFLFMPCLDISYCPRNLQVHGRTTRRRRAAGHRWGVPWGYRDTP